MQFITVAKEESTAKETKPAAKTTTTQKATAAKKTTTTKAAAAKSTAPKSDKKEEDKPVEKPKEEVKKEQEKTVEPKKEIVLEEFKDDKKEDSATAKTEPAKQATQTKPIYSYKREKKPVNKGLVWAIAIGVPIAVIFVWGLLNFDTVSKVLKKDKAKTEQVAKNKTAKKNVANKKAEETAKKEEARQKETPVNKEAVKTPEAKKTEVQKPTTPQKKYYIIAGSFKNEKYAIDYMNKLNAEGYNAEKLAERNGMHAVSYNSFTDKRKAIAEYKFLAQEKGLQAWILYY